MTNFGLGCGASKIMRCGAALSINRREWAAFRPTSTSRRRFGSNPMRVTRCGTPIPISCPVAARMVRPLPRYQGMMFHMSVRSRGKPASRFSSNQFFAVSSGLSRDTKPDAIACGPGASSRNRHSAATPPSRGSKFGSCTSARAIRNVRQIRPVGASARCSGACGALRARAHHEGSLATCLAAQYRLA